MPKLEQIKKKVRNVIPMKLDNLITIDIPYYFKIVSEKCVGVCKEVPFRLKMLGKDIELKFIDISTIPTKIQIKRLRREMKKRTRFYMDNKAATFYIKKLESKIDDLEQRFEEKERKKAKEKYKNAKKKKDEK